MNGTVGANEQCMIQQMLTISRTCSTARCEVGKVHVIYDARSGAR